MGHDSTSGKQSLSLFPLSLLVAGPGLVHLAKLVGGTLAFLSTPRLGERLGMVIFIGSQFSV